MFAQNQYDPGIPIYLQIMRRIRQKITAGEWLPGDRVAPVRDLALEFGVNPNTMQRSLSELEREGLVYTERTSGRFITTDTACIQAMRDDMAREIVMEFLREMAQMGYTDTMILEQIQNAKTGGMNPPARGNEEESL